MGNFLENLLRGTEPVGVTEYFLWFIVALFVASAVLSKLGKCNRLVANTPNLLTSVGILGTFTGIVIGLMGFDAYNIDGSINGLLEGLKTAFITSLVGMFGSIMFKVVSSTPLLLHQNKVADTDIASALLETMRSQEKQLEALHSAIAGGEESSLAGQIKLFRSDTRDHHDTFTRELWSRLANFSEMLSKSATEQVINALKEVIADFNKNLTEQFGENFKALDASVHQLVEWQENYRNQLEQMGEQYQQGVAAITQTELSVAHISEKLEQIPQTMESLKAVLEVNQHQIEELSRHLQAFKEVRDQAVEAVPELQRQIKTTVTSISDATQQLAAGINESASSLKTQTEQIREQLNTTTTDLTSNIREMMQILIDGAKSITQESANMKDVLQETGVRVQKDAQAIQQEVANSIEQMQKSLESALQEVFQAQTQEVNKAFARIEQAMINVAERTGDNVNSQLKLIDKSLEQEIERVMQEMGSALASISGKFTDDYEKLTSAMQAIVQRGDRQ